MYRNKKLVFITKRLKNLGLIFLLYPPPPGKSSTEVWKVDRFENRKKKQQPCSIHPILNFHSTNVKPKIIKTSWFQIQYTKLKRAAHGIIPMLSLWESRPIYSKQNAIQRNKLLYAYIPFTLVPCIDLNVKYGSEIQQGDVIRLPTLKPHLSSRIKYKVPQRVSVHLRANWIDLSLFCLLMNPCRRLIKIRLQF